MKNKAVRNSIYWVEIPVKNFDRAKKFYETIFNIEMPLISMPRGRYAIFPLDKDAPGAGGAIVEGNGYAPTKNGVIVYLDRGNEDMAIPLSKVEAAAGKIILDKIKNSDNKGTGFIAQFIDTEGNRIGLHSME